MLKKYIFPALLLFNLHLSFIFSQNPELATFMEYLEEVDLEEAKEKITLLKKIFEDDALLKDHHKDLKRFTKEEEKILDEMPEYLDRKETEILYDNYFSPLVLSQFYYPDKTVIQITDKGYDIDIPDFPTYILKKIWYHDGSIETPNTSFISRIDAPQKLIDSILVVATYKYGNEIYEVKDRIDIENGSIEVKQMKDNKVVVAIKGKNDRFCNMIALNDEGKPLVNLDLSINWFREDFYKTVILYVKALEKVEKKIRKIKDLDKVKDVYRKHLAPLPSLWDDENSIVVYKGYYEGNVDAALICFIPEPDKNKVEREFILRNNWEIPLAIPKFDEETDKYGLIGPLGEEVVPPMYPEFFQINNFYYGMGEELTYVYATSNYSLHYLDIDKKELVELPDIEDYFPISRNSHLAIKKDGYYALWDQTGKPITDYMYDEMTPMYDGVELVRVRIGEYRGIVNFSGETKLPVTAEEIGYYRENPIVTVLDREKGYLLVDRKGDIAISLSEYSYAGFASEGMVPVGKDNKYGFVDILTGEVVIPLIYDEINESFSPEGVVAVMYEGLWGLINTSGEFIVEPTFQELETRDSSSYKWRFMLDDIRYDAYGQRLEND